MAQEEPEHPSVAAQVAGGVIHELYEDSSHLINGALEVKGDRKAPSPGLWQRRITAQEKSQAGERGRPRGPPSRTAASCRCSAYGSPCSAGLGWLRGKDTTQGKGAGGLWGTSSSDQQPWHMKDNTDRLHRGAGQGTLRGTKQVPNWVPWDPETIWAGTEMRGKAGEENSTL